MFPPHFTMLIPARTWDTRQARERDHSRCVLTYERVAIEVCHLVPYSSGRTPDSFINIFYRNTCGDIWTQVESDIVEIVIWETSLILLVVAE